MRLFRACLRMLTTTQLPTMMLLLVMMKTEVRIALFGHRRRLPGSITPSAMRKGVQTRSGCLSFSRAEKGGCTSVGQAEVSKSKSQKQEQEQEQEQEQHYAFLDDGAKGVSTPLMSHARHAMPFRRKVFVCGGAAPYLTTGCRPRTSRGGLNGRGSSSGLKVACSEEKNE